MPDQSTLHRSHLATVTPVAESVSRRVMNKATLVANALKLIAFQTSWILFAIIGAALLSSSDDLVASGGLVSWNLAVALMVLQFCLIFVYPEWPINLSLCQKLRRVVSQRPDCPEWVDENARVVELVPRERWKKSAFETATDLLLIHVDDDCVMLEGDCDRYYFPAASILSAEFHPIRPPGWFTSTNMVIITAKTATGPIEIPIAFRDHQFGTLRNSRRRQAAIELVDQINRIAMGDQFQVVSFSESLPIRRASSNPYASPAF